MMTDTYEDEAGHLFVTLAGPSSTPATGSPAPPPPAPPAPREAAGRRPAREAPTSAYDALLDSVLRSRSAPTLSIPLGDRERAPWPDIERARTGAHRWLRPAGAWPSADGLAVLVLDRRGSFPSAMSSVPVAATPLAHRGRLYSGPPRNMAGIYRITPPAWDDSSFPPPLGTLAYDDEYPGTVWVTDPHLQLLTKRLGYDDIEIHDSWLGAKSTSLFQGFSSWARDRRNSVRGTPDEGPVKGEINRTIQQLYSTTPSGFWRPDWWAAIVAEARCRHWAKAWEARRHGAEVVGLTREDEVALLAPAGSTTPPPPYAVGTGYGQVSVKAAVSAAEWRERLGGADGRRG